ncbi:MAG TPA: hypothetical protein VFK40_02245 [Nitrososphaeraceae archaeon]|nr:hypothetical protein [Nitrososphaeraceae archaeon]HET8794393.1 hypothetical protein [Nitrososphaeraceae archaeon]
MKIVLTTTFLVAFLAIDIFGINNVFAQRSDTSMMDNDTGMIMNATLEKSIPMNANLHLRK